MSSRNAYLSVDERARALGISRGLRNAAEAFAGGERQVGVLRDLARKEVESIATSVDYVAIADADSIHPIADDALSPLRALLAVACRIGPTRLIDNVVLGEDPPPSAS